MSTQGEFECYEVYEGLSGVFRLMEMTRPKTRQKTPPMRDPVAEAVKARIERAKGGRPL